MILSIIIPYYNVAPYTDELLKCLAPQIREGVEVILVDDGSLVPYKTDYKWNQDTFDIRLSSLTLCSNVQIQETCKMFRFVFLQ